MIVILCFNECQNQKFLYHENIFLNVNFKLTPFQGGKHFHTLITKLLPIMMLIFVWSCDKGIKEVDETASERDNGAETSTFAVNSDIKLSRKTLHKFAKSFAKSFVDQDFKKFNKEELEKEWNGDLQYLVHTHLNFPLNNTGKNYKSLLVGNELDASSESEIMSSKKIRILATEYTYEKIQKNGYDDLIVLIEPDTEDAKIIEGYTISGMPISVSSISEPKNPVIIVGYCEICNDEQTNKLSNEPTIPQSNLRRTNGYAERVTWVHIPNLSTVESWWDGKPEMKITAICYNQNTIDQNGKLGLILLVQNISEMDCLYLIGILHNGMVQHTW